VTGQHYTLHEDGTSNLNVTVLILLPCEALFCNVQICLPSRSGVDAVSCDRQVRNVVAKQLVQKWWLPA
jgi:hypothetical protein